VGLKYSINACLHEAEFELYGTPPKERRIRRGRNLEALKSSWFLSVYFSVRCIFNNTQGKQHPSLCSVFILK
jgi:hypothetical protein